MVTFTRLGRGGVPVPLLLQRGFVRARRTFGIVEARVLVLAAFIARRVSRGVQFIVFVHRARRRQAMNLEWRLARFCPLSV